MKEQEQHLGLLRQLKDYDEKLTQELAAKAYQEQEKQRLEVQFTSLFLAGTVYVSMNTYQFGGTLFNLPSLRVSCYDGENECNRIKT